MSPRPRIARAFTLVELLVVIAIITLLVSLLVPYIGKGRQFALRVICCNNMRNIGVAGLGFAAEHDGRGPGGAARVDSSVTWPEVLNAEFFKEYQVQRMGYERQKGKLYCPNMKFWGSLYPRGHYWNGDATGGWDGTLPEGPYGKAIDPVPQYLVTQYGPFASGTIVRYSLGAKMDRFREPGKQYLLLESEAGNDVFGAETGTIQFSQPLAPWWGLPSDGGYGFAYRHVLPLDETLYSTQATGNFLFVDGHVETFTPPETINTIDRFVISQ